MRLTRFSILACMVSTTLLLSSVNASAESWYEFDQDPRGKVRDVPATLERYPIGANTEMQYPPDQEFTLWVQDEEYYKPKEGDRIELKKVLEKEVSTIKLKDAVPDIGFASGKIDIPESYIEKLRDILREMRNRTNVRLHFIGHSDSDRLGPGLRAKYIDNVGLSKFRAQQTAEYFQRELDLPPDAVSFDGVGDTRPIASNDTAAGKARNRRVEVQVWYDEIEEKAVEKEVVVKADKLKRVKVCREQTVCKLSYKKGSAKRARLQNLVKPLRFEVGQSGVPDEFLKQIIETLDNLGNKQNVSIRFVGHTDNLPLEGADKRIYGDHVNLSKARARYISLEVQDRLGLTNAQVSSSGKGMKYPVASNTTEKGRALNRRIELEFWYDDPFQEFTEDPQACPDAAGSEVITMTYDPPTGPVRAIKFRDGEPVIPKGYAERLKRTMGEIEGKANVRLSFIGYTSNERLDRRTAMVYGDDIGLSRARARRAMEALKEQMELTDKQVEYDGRGYVHSKDVVSTGFIQFDDSRVEVTILYDELALLDELENLEIERIERESVANNPYALNLMRITVDGETLFDPNDNTEDIQRCTDVALESADIQFRFNNLKKKPRLHIAAWPKTIRYQDIAETEVEENLISFRMYSNYSNFIDKAEVRLFEARQSTRSAPLAVIPADKTGGASWKAEYDDLGAGTKRLAYVLRVYDQEGNFDETVPQSMWVVNQLASERRPAETVAETSQLPYDVDAESPPSTELSSESGKDGSQESRLASDDLLNAFQTDLPEVQGAEQENAANDDMQIVADDAVTFTGQIEDVLSREDELLAGYGENHLYTQQIDIKGGTVTINGSSIPQGHEVWLAGRKVPVNDKGEFVSEQLFPRGLHTIEVAVLDKEGNGELFLRDMEFARNDWFYVAIGDITVARDFTNGPAKLVTQDEDAFNDDLNLIGRFAYYTEGSFGDDWRLTSSADTQEAPVDELFSNFLEKNPRALLRRLDPDLYYPTFADDSTLEERAPTSGKLYLKLQRHNSYGILGNFTIDYLDTTLSHVDRGLYGVTGHYESDDYTTFGEQKLLLDGFAAEPGTISGRDEFRGTGGSLYFLRHQDVLIGSERLRVEVRDKDSGVVIAAKNLVPVIDYDFDYIQGRILLSEPLSSVAADGLLISDSSISGNPVFLVSRYEYSPGFDEIDTLSVGGRAHYWFNDNVKLGFTATDQEADQEQSSLSGVDLTLRKSAGTWVKVEAAKTEGSGGDSLNSVDGGFSFDDLNAGLEQDVESNAYRIEANALVDELVKGGKGTASIYAQQSEEGFSAPGQLSATDLTLYGGRYRTDLTKRLDLDVKVDTRDQDQGLKTQALDVTTGYQATEKWRFSGGGRFDNRADNSAAVAETQTEGDRFDVAAEAHYDSRSNWTAYGFTQATAATSGNREDNHRVGAGGSIRPTDRLNLDGELSFGSNGTGAKAGTDYLLSDRSNIYSSYIFENARSDNGARANRGNWNTGMRSRFTDTVSVYGEERYTHGDVPTGLTHAMGVDYTPDERWNFGGNVEAGELKNKDNGSVIERLALGVNAGYNFGATILTSALEYRVDETENPADSSSSERTTWLMKNNLRYQVSLDWRFLAKANFSRSESSLGDLYDGNFIEFVSGFGYRPVDNDRLNSLFKYTYFYNVPFSDVITDPLTGQVTGANQPVDFIQKSHILSFDTIYDLTQRWSIGGKYAYRLGQLAQDRQNPEFFESNAHLYILRADWHFTHRWDALIEARMLDLPEAQDRRSGALLGLYRHIGNNVKVGVGYNFTDFSDDLTDLDYDSQGLFINFVGKI